MGKIEGVITARAAWKNGLEVVELSFNPEIISYEDLVRAADRMDCATAIFAHDDEQLAIAQQHVTDRAGELGDASTPIENTDAHQFRHLRATPLIHLPLTEAQANKVNAAIQQSKDPAFWLSPRQQALLVRIAALIDAGHAEAFEEFIFPSDPEQVLAYADALDALLAQLEAAGQ